MTRTKSPLVSLEAKGSLGSALTFQSRYGVDFVRKKPTPALVSTLPKYYQSWLYQDYVALWHTQTSTQKQFYATAGTRLHLTAFQYFMKYHLTYLPDIIGFYKLDDNGATTPDSSRNKNAAAVFGASPVTAFIDGGLLFDGINDYVKIPHISALNPTDITIEFILSVTSIIGLYDTYVSRDEASNRQFSISRTGVLIIRCGFNIGAPNFVNLDFPFPSLGTPHVYNVQYSAAGIAYGFVDGAEIPHVHTAAGDLIHSTKPINLGRWPYNNTRYSNCIIDNLIIYNRLLSSSDVLRHAQRRWPL